MHVHHGSPENLFERSREAQDLDALARRTEIERFLAASKAKRAAPCAFSRSLTVIE